MKHYMVTPQEPKPTGAKVEVTPVLTPKRAELVTQKFQTPETKTAEAKISQQTFDTLSETISFNIDIANQMTSVDPASFLGKFMGAFKAQYPDIDFKNAGQVKEKANDFLKTGGGKAILTSLKLLETQGALLSAGSGAHFKELKKATPGKEPKIKKVFKVGKDGLTVDSTPETVDKKFLFFTYKASNKGTPPTEGEFIMEMKDNFTYGIQITDTQEKEYLRKCGFVDGLDLKNDPQAQELLITRLGKIAQARTELFLETGKDFAKVDLNFVDASGNYLNTRSPHFIGEVGIRLKASDLANEGAKIADEIKTEVQQKIKEKIDEAQKSKLEGTATQLKAKIEKIKSDARLSPEEKQKKLAEVKREGKQLEDELALFERKKALPQKITTAEKTRDEAKDKVVDREVELRAGRRDPSIDLLKWSGDMSEPESCISFKARLDGFRNQQKDLQVEIDDLRADLTDEVTREPKVVMESITEIDPSTGNPSRKEFPNAADMSRRDKWDDRMNSLREKIEEKRKQMREDNWPGETKSISKLISELQAEYDKRKAVIDDSNTQQLLIGYRNEETAVKDFEAERLKVEAKIATLTKTESQIEDELKKAKEKEDVIENDKVDVDDQRETEALEGFATLFTGESKQAMENRILEKEQAIASGVSLLLEWGPDFDGYPKAILETVRLMFGDEVISAYPPAEKQALTKQVRALLSSAQYIDIIINVIEDAGGATDKVDQLTPSGAKKNVEIKKADLQTKTSGKSIETVDLNKLDRKMVEKIIKEMRVKALGIKSP